MADPRRCLSIYHGTNFLGRIVGAGTSWRAFDARGNPIGGEYKTSKAATAAVNVAPDCSCVGDTSARRDNSG